jgi:hypothetical protein
VHNKHLEAHILQKIRQSLHINLEELFEIKIPALKTKGKNTNILILETLATEGPLLKYDVYKKLKDKGIKDYSTIARRIDNLRKKGYIDNADTRNTKRGKQEPETRYGLTWKGFITSLVSNNVRKNSLEVIEKNVLLAFPEKEFALLVIKDVFTQEEVETIANCLIYGYLKAIPNLESINEKDFWVWIPQALKEIPYQEIDLKMLEKKDLFKLLDNPKILSYLQARILPLVPEYKKQIDVIASILTIACQIAEYIKELNPEDNPSEKLKEKLKIFNIQEKLFELETVAE